MARLIVRPAQSRLQFLFLLLPTSVLSLVSLIKRGAGVFDLFDLGFVFPIGLLKSSFGFCNCLFPPLTLFLSRGLFLPMDNLTPFLLPLERECGISGSFVIDLVSRWLFSPGLRLCSRFRDLIDLR